MWGSVSPRDQNVSTVQKFWETHLYINDFQTEFCVNSGELTLVIIIV